jgi:hypothetical protein
VTKYKSSRAERGLLDAIFVGLAKPTKGKKEIVVFRFIIEYYSSLRDFGLTPR